METLLAPAWDELGGSTETRMAGFKVRDRTEAMHSEPPLLTFKIVRHGAVVSGSVYGEIQIWTVDVQGATVTCADGGRRAVAKRQSPVHVEPIAEEIADAIRKGGEDIRLNGERIQSTGTDWKRCYLPTQRCNRHSPDEGKRLRVAIRERLQPHGWREVKANVYQRE